MDIPEQVRRYLDTLGPVNHVSVGAVVLGMTDVGLNMSRSYLDGKGANARDAAARMAAASIRLVEYYNANLKEPITEAV